MPLRTLSERSVLFVAKHLGKTKEVTITNIANVIIKKITNQNFKEKLFNENILSICKCDNIKVR